MKTLDQVFGNKSSASSKPRMRALSRVPLQITAVMLCSWLVFPGIGLAKKPVTNDAGCAALASDIYTGYPFTVKVVRDPAYPGSWLSPTVDVTAIFTKTDGTIVTRTASESISKYGVTYVNVPMIAPSCNGDPCDIAYESEPAVITAAVQVPINKGKQVRETICAPAMVTVTPSM